MKRYTDKDRSVSRLRINVQRGLSGLIMISILSMMGCQELPPTNPYDPKTPEVIQARGSFSVQVESPIEEYDWSTAIAEISSLDSAEIDTHSIDSTGMLMIGDLLANTYRLVISAPGHIDHVELINVRAGHELVGSPVTLLAKKESEDESVYLTGEVKLSGSEDHGGVQVRAFIGQQQQASDLSATNGSFSLRLSPLDHRVTLSADGYVSTELDVQWSEARERFETVVDGASLAIDMASISLEVNLSASVSGSLSTTIEEYPWVTSATVALDGITHPINASVIPLGDGTFSADQLQPGLYQLSVTAQGHVQYSSLVELTDGETQLEPISLGPVQKSEEAVFLTGTVDLAGRDDESGVQVRAFIGQQQQASDLSATNGSFSLRLSPLDHTLTLSKEGYVAKNIEVQWSETRTSFETIVNDQSMPLNEATFTLERRLNASLTGELSTSLNQYDWSTVVITLDEIEGDFTQEGSALAGGQFNFNSLPTGLYLFSVNAPGHEEVEQIISLGEVERNLGEIELTVVRELDNAQGQALLEGLDTHENITVRARVGGSLVATTLTDESGRFIITLPPVNLSLHFSKDGFNSSEIELIYQREGVHEGRFTLNDLPLDEIQNLQLSRLTGRVSVDVNVLPTWIPVGQREVSVSILGEGEERSAIALGNPVVFTDLPAGDYIVFADRSGFSEGRVSVTLNDHDPIAEVTLTISLNSLQEARIDLSGVPLSGDDLRAIDDLRGADFSGALLAEADLCGLDLSGAIFAGTNLINADLSGVKLVGARLDNVLLEDASLVGADLNSASLFGANLREARLHNGVPSCGTEVMQTSLANTNLSFADLSGALLTSGDIDESGNTCDVNSLHSPLFVGAVWTQSNLSNAVLNGARLVGAHFNNTTLNGAQLNNACLTDSTILRSDFTQALMNNANLSDSSIIDTLLNEVSAHEAILDGVIFSGANLTQAQFNGSSAQRPASFTAVIFNEASFQASDLSGSSLVGSFFNQVNFTGAILDRADLRNSEVIDSTFTGVSMSETDLRSSNLSYADMTGVDFTGAVLRGSALDGAKLEDAVFTDAELLGVSWELARFNDQTVWPESFDELNQNMMGPGVNLQGYRFPVGFDASGVQLTGADLRDAYLVNINLEGSNLTDVNLNVSDDYEADLSMANMRNAILNNTSIKNRYRVTHNIDFSGAQISNSEMELGGQLTFDNADIENTKLLLTQGGHSFIGTSIVFVNFDNSTLSNTNFDRSDISNSNFKHCWFDMAQLTPLNIVGSDFSDLRSCPSSIPEGYICIQKNPIEHSFYPYTMLNNESISNGEFYEADLSGLDLAEFDLSQFSFVRTTTSSLLSCPFALPEDYICAQEDDGGFSILGRNVIVQGESFTGTNLSDMNLSASDFSETMFTNSDLSNTDLSNSTLDGADFSSSILDRVSFEGTSLQGANLSGSSLQSANFKKVDLGSFSFDEGSLAQVIFDWETVCPNPEDQPMIERCGGIFDVPCTWSESGCPELDWVEIEGGEGNIDTNRGEITLNMGSFDIMRGEITFAEYQRCLITGFCESVSVNQCMNPYDPNLDDFPLSCLSFIDIISYSTWLGENIRPPSRGEFLFAAYGHATGLPEYPWGDNHPSRNPFECDYANIAGCVHEWSPLTFSPICSFELGNTPQGVCDLYGNVGEWLYDEEIVDGSRLPGETPYCSNNNCNLDLNIKRQASRVSAIQNDPDNHFIDSRDITLGGRLVRLHTD